MSRLCRTNETLLYIYNMSNTQHNTADAIRTQPIVEHVHGVMVEHWNETAQNELVQRVDDVAGDKFWLSCGAHKLRKLATTTFEGNAAIVVEVEHRDNDNDKWRGGIESMDSISRAMMHHGMVYVSAYHYNAEREWTGARLFFIPFTALING